MIFRKRKKVKGFTLPELLVVLCIIGILVILVIPKLMPLISKAKSTEAQLQLGHLHTLEKSYFYLHSRYSDSFDELGFEQEKLVTQEGPANYQIEILEAGVLGFRAKAIAVVDFDGDGVFNTWEIDQDKKLVEIIRD